MLTISIELAEGKEEMIQIYKSQTAIEVAQEFIKKHNLPEDIKIPLVESIQEKIKIAQLTIDENKGKDLGDRETKNENNCQNQTQNFNSSGDSWLPPYELNVNENELRFTNNKVPEKKNFISSNSLDKTQYDSNKFAKSNLNTNEKPNNLRNKFQRVCEELDDLEDSNPNEEQKHSTFNLNQEHARDIFRPNYSSINMNHPKTKTFSNVYDRLYNVKPLKNRKDNSTQNQGKSTNCRCTTPNFRLNPHFNLIKGSFASNSKDLSNFNNLKIYGQDFRRDRSTGDKASARLYCNGIQRIAEKEKLIREHLKSYEEKEMEEVTFKPEINKNSKYYVF